MPSTRLAASRHTANASGRILSSASPSAMRFWNSGVLAFSASSESFCISGSRALILATMRSSWRRSRSLRLPKTRVSSLLIIEKAGWNGTPWTPTRRPGAGASAPPTAIGHCSLGRRWPNSTPRPTGGWPSPCLRKRKGPPLDGGGPQARASGRSAAAAARDRGAVVAQELARVDHGAVLPDLEVHVGTGRASGGTGLGHFLSGTDQVAALHHQARVVRVAGDVAVAMVDLDGLAVTAAVVGEADHAVGHGHHRVADVGVEVDALVELATAAERIGATAEAGGDVRTPHRRARRHRVGFQLHVEQQRFHHRELTSGGGKLALDLVEALDQLFLRHVTRDFGTTLARRSLEVELAVLELAGLGEALAE